MIRRGLNPRKQVRSGNVNREEKEKWLIKKVVVVATRTRVLESRPNRRLVALRKSEPTKPGSWNILPGVFKNI